MKLIAPLIVLLLVSPLCAANCASNNVRNNSSCNSTYCAPTYHAAATYCAPAEQLYRENVYDNRVQNIFYEVGADVRYPIVAPQAIVQAEYGQLERELQRVQDKMTDLKQYSTYRQQIQQPQLICVPAVQAYCAPAVVEQQLQQRQTYTEQQQLQQRSAVAHNARGVVDTKCLKCHGNNGQTKGNLDLRDQISCEQFKHAMARLMTDDNDLRMPKGQPPLSGEETAGAIKELLAMTIQDRPQPAQLPANTRAPRPAQLPASTRPPQAVQLPGPAQPPPANQLPAEPPPAPAPQPATQPEVPPPQ